MSPTYVIRLATLLLLGTLAGAMPALVAVADPGRAGPWTWPVGSPASPPSVLRSFAPPDRPWLPGHRGVDLEADVGSTVRSAGAGVVSYAGLLAGRGVVAVVHGDLRTTYEPVTAAVSVGLPVAAGQAIGRLESPGHCVPTACLHWGLLRGDTYLDPLSLVSGGPVRLLPLGGAAFASPALPAAQHRADEGSPTDGRVAGLAGSAGAADGAAQPAGRVGNAAQPTGTAGDRSGGPLLTAGLSLGLAAGAAAVVVRARRAG
jgi:murein DD-endopeptidase MepM/ murein hydrolase activator NlpD